MVISANPLPIRCLNVLYTSPPKPADHGSCMGMVPGIRPCLTTTRIVGILKAVPGALYRTSMQEITEMEASDIVHEIASLPPEAQRQVTDFVAFLKARYPAIKATKKTQGITLMDEPFIGMWRDREDMRDSVAWVRDLRRREWELQP